MPKTSLQHTTLAFVLGGQQQCIEWVEWAKQFVLDFAIDELEKALQALAEKVGREKVRQVYRKRLAEEVRNAPVRWTTALDVTSGQEVKVPGNDQLLRLIFEILCLGRLASFAEKMTLLTQKESEPEAEVWFAGHKCMVEVKWYDDPVMRKEAGKMWSRFITDPRPKGVRVPSENLPAHVHLRDKLEGVTEKFKSSPESVNLVLVYWSSIVDVDRSFVPALYGERFMKIPFHLLHPPEFTLPQPDELGEDGLFAREDWRLVSGVAGLWAMRFPIFEPRELKWGGMLFPNPKALIPIPQEVAAKLGEALGLFTVGTIQPLFTAEEAEALYDRHVRPLEEKFWGRLAAVNKEGQVLVGDDEVDLTQKAVERFGKGKFILFRIGTKAVGRI
ncbi:MAG: hypothetical protein BDTLLHRC_000035 [Candidatus Fervidibacter sp.]